jgi:hypothetical protein
MRSQSDVEMGIIEYVPAGDVVDSRCFDFLIFRGRAGWRFEGEFVNWILGASEKNVF